MNNQRPEHWYRPQTVAKAVPFFLLLLTLILGSFDSATPVIYIIGDSTAANKNTTEGRIERGWGMFLHEYLDNGVRVEDHAVNGRSSRSFYTEGRWKKVIDKVMPGDYVIIQFGHNDEKPEPDRHTDVGTTFDAHLAQYVIETKAKGATPVLMSPVVRRNFQGDSLVDTHGAYRLVAEKVARQYGAVYVDANAITHDIEQRLGPDGTIRLHMWVEPGKYSWAKNGRKDDTHYNIYGAHVVAAAFAKALGDAVPALKSHVRVNKK